MGKNVKCTVCEEAFSLDVSMYDDGDVVTCPACGADLELAIDGKKVQLFAVDDANKEDINDEWEESED